MAEKAFWQANTLLGSTNRELKKCMRIANTERKFFCFNATILMQLLVCMRMGECKQSESRSEDWTMTKSDNVAQINPLKKGYVSYSAKDCLADFLILISNNRLKDTVASSAWMVNFNWKETPRQL